jgi:xanthine/CO dehydrogenase XdhC/CoxF family maturation factor
MRRELPSLIDLASRLLGANEPGLLATLFAATGSTYRSIGALMVAGPGVTAGGVSGGCLEEYIARHGREITREKPAAIISFDTGGDPDDAKPVLGCGGSIDVLLERVTPGHLEFLQQLAMAHESDEPSIVTVTFDSNRVERSWKVDGEFAKLAGRALSDQRSYFTPPPLRGEGARTLVHYIPPLTRLAIFGAGDDVQPLANIANDLGWHVTIADRRSRKATAERFPRAEQVIAEPWDIAIPQIRFTPQTAVLLMTHSVADDAQILPLLASKDVAYLGMLGPAHRRENLLQLIDRPDLAPRLHGPIGLDLGDRSAAGIAVAVAAEILAHLNDRTPQQCSKTAGPQIHADQRR